MIRLRDSWNIWPEVAALIALIIVLFLPPYEKAAYQVNFDCDAPSGADRLWFFRPQS
jgi:hypothetical protein